MDTIIKETEYRPLEPSMQMIKEEIIEDTSTSGISMDDNDNPLQRAEPEQPLISQSERNSRQMVEDENLITAVQKFPTIFDRTSPNYHNKEHMRYVWSAIAEDTNRSGELEIFLSFE